MRKHVFTVVAAAALIAVGGCNRSTPQGQNVADVTDNMADNVDKAANNTTGAMNDRMENKADAMRHNGKEDAANIDKMAGNGAAKSQLDQAAAKAMSNASKEAKQ